MKRQKSKKHKKKTIFTVYVLRIIIFLAISLGLTTIAIGIAMPYGTRLVNAVEASMPMNVGDVTLDNSFGAMTDVGNIPSIDKIPYGRQVAVIQCDDIDLKADCYFGANRISMRNGVGISGEYTLFGEEGVSVVTGYEQGIFSNLDKIEKGSEVKVSCKYGEYTYVVYDKLYKPEKDNFLTNNSGDNLILTGICSDFSQHSGERLYVYAKCKGEV